MAATVYRFSTNVPAGMDRPYTALNTPTSGSLNQGAGTTDIVNSANDFIELSIKTVKADGTTKTNITKRDVLNFLEMCHRWVYDSGAGVGDGLGQGLDYVIRANSGTVGVP